MKKRFICIDPGKSGSICIREGSEIVDVAEMPDTCQELRDYIEDAVQCQHTDGIPVVAYLEEVHAMPGQGVTSMFTFGNGFGHLEQVLADFRVRTIRVRPNQWQKTLGLISSKELSKADHKRNLKVRAQELFPSIKVTAVNQDSLLISEYAYLKEK